MRRRERAHGSSAASWARTHERLHFGFLERLHRRRHGGVDRRLRAVPKLTDRDWLYVGEAKTIQASIANGRTGVMPAFGEALGEDKIKDVAHYVLSLSGGTADSIRVAKGQETFATICAACHGAEG